MLRPIQDDSPKKPDQQLPSDPEKSPVHNLANNTDSEPEDPSQQGERDFMPLMVHYIIIVMPVCLLNSKYDRSVLSHVKYPDPESAAGHV